MATHSSILAWKTPWMEKPGGLQSMESQRGRQNFHFHGLLLLAALFSVAKVRNIAWDGAQRYGLGVWKLGLHFLF